MKEFVLPSKQKGWRVWRGCHRATNQSYRVRRISVVSKALLPFRNLDERDYAYGRAPPNYPMPALRDVRTWDLWILYRPYLSQYVIDLRQSR